jgi:tricorn protease-like protein/mono/diheme cytochrome c family protein
LTFGFCHSFVIGHWLFVILLSFLNLLAVSYPAQASTTNDYSAVDSIFSAHCLDCHAGKDPEGQLVLESFETLMKGGEIGPAVMAGKSGDSLLVQMVEGRFEKNGKKKIMPPGKRAKLTPEQIATIKAWIDAGALPSAVPSTPKELAVPKILPKIQPRNPINALAFASSGKYLAVARYGEVELRSPSNLSVVRTLTGHKGNVNALAFSSDGSRLFAAGGQPAVSGEVRQWKVEDGTLERTLEGHKDAIYSLALSPDGKTLATGSYDQKIKLWDLETGKETKTLSGHNGCVYHLAFRNDGQILASASADRTVKLWDVASGERRDTLTQSLKELYALAFSPDGKQLVAGGADNRIRVWGISEAATETTDPMLHSKFAHEGAILSLMFSSDGKTLVSSADDRTVKVWDSSGMKERLLLEKQTDWAPALAFVSDTTVIVGRLDGTLSSYDVATGKLLASIESSAKETEVSEQRDKLANANPSAASKGK